MKKQNELEKVENDFVKVVKVIDTKFGIGYSYENPGLVQHLIDTVQREEDRTLQRALNSL